MIKGFYWRAMVAACPLRPISIALLWVLIVPLAMAQTPVACVAKAKPVTETIACIRQAVHAPAPAAHAIPDACAALADLRAYAATLPEPDKPTSDPTTPLETACAQQDYLQLGDKLRAQNRFDEAIAAYNNITGTMGLPDVLRAAREGRNAALIAKNTLAGPPSPVADLESQRKFDEAYKELEKDVPASDAHRSNLTALLLLEKQTAEFDKQYKPDEALKAWTAYLAKLDPIRDQFLLNEAYREISREQGFQANFAASVPRLFLTVFGWIPYIIVLFAIFVAIWVISLLFRLRTRPQILLSMQDLTAAVVGDQSNQLLTDQMRRQMEPPMPSKNLRIDTPTEMDGSSLGQLGIRVPLRALSTEIRGISQISFGPLSISPTQLIDQLAPLFRPRYRMELQGSLSTEGADTVCKLASTNRDESPVEWTAVATGDGARDQALRDVAMQVLVVIDPETRSLTQDWRSLSQLRQGIDLLQSASNNPAQRGDLWKAARVCFQESVLEDPGNWLARFNLGTVLRKLGFNSLAAEQFDELRNHSRLPKEYRQVVKYNRAAALQKADDENLAQKAINLLEEILDAHPDDPILNRLAASGLLAAQADQLARRKRRWDRIGQEDEHSFREQVEETLERGEAVRKEVEGSITGNPEDGDPAGGADENLVLAVTLNAMGQLEGLLGHNDQARERYRRALTLLPSFIEAGLNLAGLYIAKKMSLDRNWATRAQRLLLDVQAIDATNTRCLVLLGQLYSNPVFGKEDKAIPLFQAAIPDPEAGLRLAGLFLDQGNPADAVAPILSSLKQNEDGSGQLLLARIALALPDTDRRKVRLLRMCQPRLKEMEKDPEKWSDARQAARLLVKVNAAIDRLSKTQKTVPAVQTKEPAPTHPDTDTANGIVLASCAPEFPKATLLDTMGALYPEATQRTIVTNRIVTNTRIQGFTIQPGQIPAGDANTLGDISAALVANAVA